MFEREHHVRVATILSSLDPDVLAQHHCWFGGGTAVALRYGEYRESVDVDFVVSDQEGYRRLRTLLKGRDDLAPLVRAGCALTLGQAIRADRNGVRTTVEVGGVQVKFEFVQEARVKLERPKEEDRVCGVLSLRPVDLLATKLLANSDRWADAYAHHRDVIDIAMMQPSRALFASGLEEAQEACGDVLAADLGKVIDWLEEHPLALDEDARALRITMPRAVVWSRIRALRRLLR